MLRNCYCLLLQVERTLARLLPNALLTALQLTYLGTLPHTTQQQLSSRWSALLLHAAGVDSDNAAHGDSSGKPTHPVYGAQAELLSHWAVRASKVMQATQLLGPPATLWQQVQIAAAVVDLACQPMLVLDPWQLLLKVLELEPGDAMLSASGIAPWFVIAGEVAPLPECSGVVAAAAAAFADGRSVCLLLHCITTQLEQLVQHIAAAWFASQAEGCSSSNSTVKSAKLLVHVSSPCAKVTPRLAGLLGVVRIGDASANSSSSSANLMPAASAGTSTSAKDARCQDAAAPVVASSYSLDEPGNGQCGGGGGAMQHTERTEETWHLQLQGSTTHELVQSLVLPAADPHCWAAAVAAAQAAEAADEELVGVEALVLQHVSQVGGLGSQLNALSSRARCMSLDEHYWAE